MKIIHTRRTLLAAALMAASTLSAPAIGGVTQADDDKVRDAEGVSRTYDADGDRSGRTVGQTVNDQVLETRVKTALIDADEVKARNIEVEVRNGVVSLSGTVDSKSEASAAVSVARSVDGVKSVDSKLVAQDGMQ